MKLLRTGDSIPKCQFGQEIVMSTSTLNKKKKMKLPRTGDPEFKYQFDPKLIMSPSQLYH